MWQHRSVDVEAASHALVGGLSISLVTACNAYARAVKFCIHAYRFGSMIVHAGSWDLGGGCAEAKGGAGTRKGRAKVGAGEERRDPGGQMAVGEKQR